MEKLVENGARRRFSTRVILVAALFFGGVGFIAWLLWPDDNLEKEEMIEIMSSPPQKYGALVSEVERHCTHAYKWRNHYVAARWLKSKEHGGNQIEAAERHWLKSDEVYWRGLRRYESVEYIYEIMTISNPGSMTPRITSRWYFLVDKYDNLLGWQGEDAQGKSIVSN